jgi:hypothetical protein
LAPVAQILHTRQQPLYRSISDLLCSACRKSPCGDFQPRHTPTPTDYTHFYRGQRLDQIGSKLSGVRFGREARRHIWNPGVAFFVPALSSAQSQLRSLACGSQIQIVQPSAAFSHAHEILVEAPPQLLCFPAGIARRCSCSLAGLQHYWGERKLLQTCSAFRPHHRMCVPCPLPFFIINPPPFHPSP